MDLEAFCAAHLNGQMDSITFSLYLCHLSIVAKRSSPAIIDMK